MGQMNLTTVMGQESIRLSTDVVEAWVTQLGGQVAPVTFQLPSGPVQPFSVAPWAEENQAIPAILKVLRGDFFCFPFGGNDEPYRDEKHPIHGETANNPWTIEEYSDSQLRMSMDTSIRKAHVEKQVWVVPGQPAIYQRDTVTGAEGPMCFGHHAMLKFQSTGHVSVAPFGFGQVFPGQFEDPVMGGYSSLKRGARFERLDSVPSNDGSTADLSTYPAREGFEDLVMVYAQKGLEFGWTAVHFPEEGYIWFSLKDPRVLSGTVLWHSNGGRHYAPWSGRHRAVLGLEEVTSSFHWGLAGSAAPSEAGREGYQTTLELSPETPLVVNTIMGVAPSEGFSGKVAEIDIVGNGIRLLSTNGDSVSVQLDIAQLYAS
jgi:hypothetical protein